MLKDVLNFFCNYIYKKEELLNIYNHIKNIVKEFKFIDFIFPPICVLCGKIEINWICENCKKRIDKFYENKIIINNKNFYKLLYIFNYEGIIRKLIIDYKFNDKSYINNFFSNIILNDKYDCDILKKYDIIISVPLSQKRYNERGYNQTDLIAKNISKKLNIVYKSDMIKKVKDTKRQSLLDKKSRNENIKNAFMFNKKYDIQNKSVILLDDVYTTGSTINECCRILRKEKVKNILVLIIAKNQKKKE